MNGDGCGRVRIGFIGCGTHAAQNLYPSLRFADCELAAAADPMEERRLYGKRHFGAGTIYESYEAMLAKEALDAVIVCGPPSLHEEAGLAALGRKLPVLVEKPPADGLEGCRRLRRAADAAGKPLMVAMMKRFAQKYEMARAIASEPAFGASRHLFIRYSYGMEATDPRHLLYLMGIHAVDLMRHFMGEPAALSVERDDRLNFTINFRFVSGSTGTLVMNATAPGVTERFELTGEGASVVVDEIAHLVHYPRPEAAWKPVAGTSLHPNFPLQTPENDNLFLQGYAGEIREFVQSVAENRPPATATIEEVIRTVELLELIARTESGRIELDPDPADGSHST